MADFLGGFTSNEMAAFGTEDLQEEQVWAVMKAREGGSSTKSKTSKNKSTSGSSSTRRFNVSARSIPRASAAAVLESHPRQSSAPLHIPDWSKILNKTKHPNKNPWEDDDDGVEIGIHLRDNNNNNTTNNVDSDGDDEEEDDDAEMVPPHEYLARRLAGTQIASFSMCEGVGGTLKGRDLSRLRNAILTKTGFIE